MLAMQMECKKGYVQPHTHPTQTPSHHLYPHHTAHPTWTLTDLWVLQWWCILLWAELIISIDDISYGKAQRTCIHLFLQTLPVFAAPFVFFRSSTSEAALNVTVLKLSPSPASDTCSIKNRMSSASSSVDHDALASPSTFACTTFFAFVSLPEALEGFAVAFAAFRWLDFAGAMMAVVQARVKRKCVYCVGWENAVTQVTRSATTTIKCDNHSWLLWIVETITHAEQSLSNKLLKRLKIGKLQLKNPRTVWNIDRSHNKAGTIRECVNLLVQVGDRRYEMCFLIMDLGEDEIVLGYPWLAAFQPCINWKDALLDEEEQPLVIRTLDPSLDKEVACICNAWIQHAEDLAEPGEEIFVQKLDSEQLGRRALPCSWWLKWSPKKKIPGTRLSHPNITSGKRSFLKRKQDVSPNTNHGISLLT